VTQCRAKKGKKDAQRQERKKKERSNEEFSARFCRRQATLAMQRRSFFGEYGGMTERKRKESVKQESFEGRRLRGSENNRSVEHIWGAEATSILLGRCSGGW